MASHASTPTPPPPPPPPPPPSEPTAATDMKPPPPPPPTPFSAAESDAPPKKRKQEEAGLHHSPYYKIRAAVANLRSRFLQEPTLKTFAFVVLKVCQATDSQKKEAALEILKEIRVLMELSKKIRLDISASIEPVKPLDIPAVGAVMNKPAGKVPPGEKNQVSQTGQASMFLHSTCEKIPLKPVSSQTAAKGLGAETQSQREAKPSEITNLTNQLSGRMQGSYVIGGSPIVWNFRMWPGGKAVYYGLTKAEWLARQAAK